MLSLISGEGEGHEIILCAGLSYLCIARLLDHAVFPMAFIAHTIKGVFSLYCTVAIVCSKCTAHKVYKHKAQ